MCSYAFEFPHNILIPFLYNMIGNFITWNNLPILAIFISIDELGMTRVLCQFCSISPIIVTIQTKNLCPYYWVSRRNVWPIMSCGKYSWGNRRNLWPAESCSINTAILGELGYPSLSNLLFPPGFPGILSLGRFPPYSWGGRINSPPIIPYSLSTVILGKFGLLFFLGSLLIPFSPGVLSLGRITISLSSLKTWVGL